MATVNKDFRIKAGLVVEGANATVNGEDVITTGSTTDNLTEGTTNKYFTDQRALDATASAYDAAGAATTAENNANDYTDTAISTAVAGLAPNYITSVSSEFDVTDGALSLTSLSGSTQINPASGAQPDNGYGTVEYIDTDAGNERLKISAEHGWTGGNVGGNLELHAYNNIDLTTNNGDIVLNPDGNAYLGSATSGQQIATQGYVDGLASNYDAAGAAGAVASDLSDHISDTSTHGVTGDIVGTSDTQSLSNKTFQGQVNFQSGGGAGGTNNNIDVNNSTGKMTVQSGYALDLKSDGAVNIVSYGNDIVLNADGSSYLGSASSGNEIATHSYVGSQGFLTSADLSGLATETYVNTAVDNLVDGAPGLLDTLNELAAAINDDANYASTLTTALSGKQGNLTAGTGISLDPLTDTISVTANTYDAYGAADTAETNAKSYADGLAANYETAGAATTAESNANSYTDGVADDITNGVTAFANVNINSVASQVAATQSVASASTVTGLTWSKESFRSAKLIVKASTAGHSQVSEILITLDASDNVAITEFGMVYTDVELATVTADVVLNDVRIRVTTLGSSTDVAILGTLLV